MTEAVWVCLLSLLSFLQQPSFIQLQVTLINDSPEESDRNERVINYPAEAKHATTTAP
jgi:hypothetical protein